MKDDQADTEREAFANHFGVYPNELANNVGRDLVWEAWQARAALAAQLAEGSAPLTKLPLRLAVALSKALPHLSDELAHEIQFAYCEIEGYECPSYPHPRLREGMQPLEAFAHEIAMGAIRWKDQPEAARLALSRSNAEGIERDAAHLSDQQLDQHLDKILRASGSALKHYTQQKLRDDMRAALRSAIAESQGGA